MKIYSPWYVLFISILAVFGCNTNKRDTTPVYISGIYPHLAYYNNEGECGTGAVVPWADKLWVITYGPHLPHGSSDKLYEITPELKQIVRKESIGGTPANRMIHRESNQLFIGPYAINLQGSVRAIPYDIMLGRHTGNARHLSDPVKKIYYGTMEEGFYEVDVNSLDIKTLYTDGNLLQKEGDMAQAAELLPGAHGKGLYSGQGVLVYSNNGEANRASLTDFAIKAGALSEWDGENWKVVRRNQFVEVTGPGGIYGNPNPETDPIWATGWDHRSVLLGVRYNGTWSFYRLPKASHSYDGAHGWNTEWPRIRNIGTEKRAEYLMTMHGMFWHFPGTFTPDHSSGIRPGSAYLKVIGDFARWNNQLVFGCDDSANREFLNKRKAKGNIEGPGQSNSNLWFTSTDQPDNLGPSMASGAVWLMDTVKADTPSEPFLFAGWPERVAWVSNHGEQPIEITFEIDLEGTGVWNTMKTISLDADQSTHLSFSSQEKGEWIRAKSNLETIATLHFSYSEIDQRIAASDVIFSGISKVDQSHSIGGLLYGLGNNRRALGIAAMEFDGENSNPTGYYELDDKMNLIRKDDPETEQFIRQKFAVPEDVVEVQESSVLVIDDRGRRWRFPLGNQAYDGLTNAAALRIDREVATERDLFSCHGTFYELPAENADGYAKIRPVASHNFRINDYASYRGMLIMTGIEPGQKKNDKHIFISEDGKAAVWAGVIDDLWKLGKPVGHGGPWKDAAVDANEPSDPYLIGFYDKRTLRLSHESSNAISFRIEVEPIGHGPWMEYGEIEVAPGEVKEFVFPDDFQARWIRFSVNEPTVATALLIYE